MPRFRLFSLALYAFLLSLPMTGCNAIRNAWYHKALTTALHENSLIVADSINDRVGAMQRVDLSGCPEDFVSAYKRYIHAWQEVGSAETDRQKLQDQWPQVLKDGILAGLPNSNETPIADYRKKIKDANARVDNANTGLTTSRQSFEDVVRKYGLQP